MPATPPDQSRAARYAFMLVLGILIGLVTTVLVARVLQARRDPVPDSLMQVMAYQLRALQPGAGAVCTPSQQARLQSLRLLSDELEPAFPGIGEDSRFGEHAQALRAALDQARQIPIADCAAAARDLRRLRGLPSRFPLISTAAFKDTQPQRSVNRTLGFR